MQNNVTNENSIFMYAMTGVLLFISSMAFVVAYMSNIAVMELSYTGMAFVLFASSMSFLYKAVKHDRNRLRAL